MRPADFANARALWREWIDKVAEQTSNLLWDEHYFQLSLEAAEKGQYVKPSNEVYQLFVRMYVVHARMAIRRLLDSDDGTYSLRALLRKMAKNPHVLTREWFVAEYPDMMQDIAHTEFDDLAGPGADALSASVLQSMLDELDRADADIAGETDKFVAHYDRKHIPDLPRATFADMRHAINVIDRVATRTRYILHQVGNNSCAPGNIDECDADCWHVWAGRVQPEWQD